MRGRLLRDSWAIAAKDTLELWRDGRWRWLAMALVATLSVASISGWVETSATARLHSEAQAAERQLSLDRGDMNPHAAAHYGAFVFKPVEALAAIDPGLDPYVGVAVFLEAHQQQGARYRPAADTTPVRRLGDLTLAGALQTLVPLLIVTLAAGAIAGERERGTLVQLLGTGVSRGALAAGKLAGVLVPIGVVLVPIAMVAVLGALITNAPGLDRDAALRAALLTMVYAVAAVVWASIALTVSAVMRSSSAALVVLFGLWCLLSVVSPRLVATAAAIWHPAPSSADFTSSVLRERAALPVWADRVANVEERYLSGELPPDPDMPSNPEVIALVDTERDESDLYDRLFEQQFAAYDRQALIYERAGWVTPALAVQALSMALSGTDYRLYRQFLAATRDYRARFLALLNAELVHYRAANTFDYTSGRELWERLPEFEFTPPTAWELLAGQLTALAALAAWTVVAVCALVVATRRMAVR